MSRRLGACAALVLVASCTPGEASSARGVQDVEPVTLVREAYTGVEERRRSVIRSDSAWSALWGGLYRTRIPVPDPPEVDFGTYLVIVAAMGTRPTGGHDITLEAVERADGGYRVVVRETTPGPTCVVTMAFTAPVIAVRVPRVDGDVTFEERTTIRECG